MGAEQTRSKDSEKKSNLKTFLKEPLSQEDLSKYGTSKPYRVVIKGYIQHGED